MFDCSQEDSIGTQELKLGGIHTKSVPSIKLLHRDGMTTYAKFDFKNLKNTITAIIRKSEQVTKPPTHGNQPKKPQPTETEQKRENKAQ